MQTKIWNVTFISIFLANITMNLGQFMSNALLSVYADSMQATANEIGILMGLFAATALLFKVVAAPAMDTYNRKYLVICAMLLYSVSYVGFSFSDDVPMLMFFRILQGCGMAFGNVCCLAMVAEALPKEKYGTGIGYYSLAQTVAQAIGPTVGLWVATYIGYKHTFFCSAGVMLVAIILALNIRLPYKKTKKLQITLANIIAKEAILSASINFLLVTSFCVINSFLIVYASKYGVTANIGLYFTISAMTMIFTRPLIGRLTDRYGLVKVFIPAIFCDVLAFFIISEAHTLLVFLIAAFVSAFGFGACQPALQTLAMKCVGNERRGAGSSTNYIGSDFGNLLGPTIAGFLADHFGYQVMWRVMIIPFLVAICVTLLYREKIQSIETKFLA